MAILRRALVLPLCMAAALLAGCAGPRLVESDVNSFSTLSALPSPPTYRIERLPSQEAHSAAYIPIEAQAEQALARVGLQRDDARPRLIAQIGAEGGYASPRYWPYYSDPFYGRFGWGLGYGGRWGWGMGMGWMMDTPRRCTTAGSAWCCATRPPSRWCTKPPPSMKTCGRTTRPSTACSSTRPSAASRSRRGAGAPSARKCCRSPPHALPRNRPRRPPWHPPRLASRFANVHIRTRHPVLTCPSRAAAVRFWLGPRAPLEGTAMKTIAISGLLWASLCGLGASAHAAGLGDALRGQASGTSALGGMLGGGADMSALSAMGLTGSGTASNAAGVITYCMKNNYLNANKAAQVKDQLLGKMGLGQKEEPKDEGYLSGLSGMVTGSGGKTFNLDKVKGDLKEKACDFVLDNAKSLL